MPLSIALSVLCGGVAAAAMALARSQGLAWFAGRSDAECALVGLAVALLFIAAGAASADRRLRRKLAELEEAASRFEALALRSAGSLETRVGDLETKLRSAEAPPVAAALPAFVGTAARSGFRPDNAPQQATARIVAIDAARSRAEAPQRPGTEDILQAIAGGRVAAWYQPVIALPSRRTRILDCVPHLSAAGRELSPDQWLAAAAQNGALASIERRMLVECIRLLRDLKRSEKPGRVLWRLSRETLRDAPGWREVLDILRASESIASYLHCEIRLADLVALETDELDRLHELREARCQLSLDCGRAVSKPPAALSAGLFSLVRAPATALLEPTRAGRVAIDNLRSAAAASVEFAAVDVIAEEEAMALIDHDVLLAQGPLLAAARPLRSQLAGE